MPLRELLFLDSYYLTFPSGPWGTCVPVVCLWGGRSWPAVLLGLVGCASSSAGETDNAARWDRGVAPCSFILGAASRRNRAMVRVLGVASPPMLAARDPRHFRPQLWARRGAPGCMRTGRGLDWPPSACHTGAPLGAWAASLAEASRWSASSQLWERGRAL